MGLTATVYMHSNDRAFKGWRLNVSGMHRDEALPVNRRRVE